MVAVLSYVAVQGTHTGPLFMFWDGKPLTRQRLVLRLWQALQSVGINHSRYSGHSFRIGAATTAASVRMEDSAIRMLGRWKSAVYLSYIRTPEQQLAGYSARCYLSSRSFVFFCVFLSCIPRSCRAHGLSLLVGCSFVSCCLTPPTFYVEVTSLDTTL